MSIETRAELTLDRAQTIVSAGLRKAEELGLKPMSIAVLDAGGHLVAFARQDGASTLRPQIACAKAGGALALGMSSRKIGEMAEERPQFVAALQGISPLGVLPAAGGVLFTGAGGRALGAVGVTGDLSDKDEQCALAGIASAGFSVVPD